MKEEKKTVNGQTPLANPPRTGWPFGLTGLFIWRVTAGMTKQKWEGAVVDQQTTVMGRDGKRPDIANMSNHKWEKYKKRCITAERREGRRRDTRVLIYGPVEMYPEHKTIWNHEQQFARWCVFPQVAVMLTQLLSLSWPGVWRFLCRVSQIANLHPPGACLTSTRSQRHICRYKCAKPWWRGPVKGLWVCVLQGLCNRTNRSKC